MKYFFLIISILSFLNCNSQKLSNEKKKFDEIFKLVSIKENGEEGIKGTVNYIDNNKILSALQIPKRNFSFFII